MWEIREEISKLLEAKMRAEKERLERRLSLRPAKTHRLKAHRSYPPVVPKFANPDDPSLVWTRNAAAMDYRKARTRPGSRGLEHRARVVGRHVRRA